MNESRDDKTGIHIPINTLLNLVESFPRRAEAVMLQSADQNHVKPYGLSMGGHSGSY